MPTPTIVQDTPTVAYAPGWAPVALTARGTAAARLSGFQDSWDELAPEDRAWFAHWLRDLLVDAVVPEADYGRR